MWRRLDELALEVKYLDPAVAFYRDTLGLDPVRREAGTAAFAAGTTRLELRTPGPIPRGGLHTHYAFSIPSGEYGAWYDELAESWDLEVHEHDFGGAKSLYCYDPDGHCVELGQRGVDGPGIAGVFEVVLEVEALDRAVALYESLGGGVIDRGDDRKRVRLDCGAVDLELWEPQLGIADARGGVHVDLTVTVDDPDRLADAAEPLVADRVTTDGGVRLRDHDGHYLTLRTADA